MRKQNLFTRSTNHGCNGSQTGGCKNDCNNKPTCCDDKDKNPCVFCPPGLQGPQGLPGGLLSIFLGGEEQAGLSMYIPKRTDKCEKRGVCQLLASWYAICGTVDIL